jgi:RNA polymerase sigma factor (sigma-70 family)
MTDQELATKCMAGNAEAQKELWKLYSRKMMAVCMRYCGDRNDAEDVLQEAFIKVFQRIHQWQGSGPLGGWIRTVVVNTNLTFLRDRKKKLAERDIDDQVAVSDVEPNAFDQLSAESLLVLISKMPEGYRTVFNLFAVEGFGHKEIAEMLAISENTSKTQFLKAKAWLKKRLSDVASDDLIEEQHEGIIKR